jgi:cell division septation protein DedD
VVFGRIFQEKSRVGRNIVATEIMDHEERGHSARYLIILFLISVVVCAVFFSMGFLVGFNERGSHSAPVTEVVTTPPVIPPTVNPPPDGGQVTPQNPSGGQASPPAVPETEVIPPGGAGTNPVPPAAKPTEVAPPKGQPPVEVKPASNPASPPSPAPGEVGEGITLQVSAGRNKQDAENMVNILKSKGYPVFLATPEYARADDNLFRVLVGPFKTHDDANTVRSKLEREGFKPFIRH